MPGIGNHLDKPTLNVGVSERLFRIHQQEAASLRPLHVLGPGATAIAVEPEVAISILEPDRVELQRPIGSTGSQNHKDR